MDNSTIQLIAEVQGTILDLQNKLDELKARLAAMEAEPEQVTVAVEPEPMPEPEPEPMPVPGVVDDMPIDISLDEVPAEPVVDLDVVAEPEPMPEPEPVPAPAPAPATVQKPAAVAKSAKPAAWKTDMVGAPVKNIISAISLNDRVLFISTLFKEDPMSFQNTISALNAMEDFQSAEDYLRAGFPDWNYDSEVVYRLMMAIRRKLR